MITWLTEAVTPDDTYVYFGYWLQVTDPMTVKRGRLGAFRTFATVLERLRYADTMP